MKQVQRFVTIALALLLVAVPAVAFAQSSTGASGGTTSGATDKPADKTTDKSSGKATGGSSGGASASPSTSGGGSTMGSGSAGQASPMTPASVEDCKKNGWQKHGFKSEAECTAKVKK